VTPEELVSEVWQKIVATGSLPDDEWPQQILSLTNPAPERDGRVTWLLGEIGGVAALAHRYEDILRQRHGRMVPGQGRRTVQHRNENAPLEDDLGYSPGDPIERADTREVLRACS